MYVGQIWKWVTWSQTGGLPGLRLYFSSRAEGSQGELAGWDMSWRPSINQCMHLYVHTLK